MQMAMTNKGGVEVYGLGCSRTASHIGKIGFNRIRVGLHQTFTGFLSVKERKWLTNCLKKMK